MPELFSYLIKVNIALIVFYLAYRFVLRALTFYNLNRFFLISGILFSLLYPFADLSWFFKKHEEIRTTLVVLIPDWNNAVVQNPINYWFILKIIFWTGVAVMMVRLITQFVSLYQIHKNSTPAEVNGQDFRHVADEINPFSFLKNIYLNTGRHKGEELDAILKHETIHVEQWHTIDVLLAEIVAVFYWFNPGVWMMKNAIKENLEFITDENVLQKGIDSKNYQYSLLRISTLKQSPLMVNNFNMLTIKRRIIMMNKNRSSFAQLSKYVLLLPVLVCMVLVFTISKAQLKSAQLVMHELSRSVIPKIEETIAPARHSAKKQAPANIVSLNNEQVVSVVPYEKELPPDATTGIVLDDQEEKQQTATSAPVNLTNGEGPHQSASDLHINDMIAVGEAKIEEPSVSITSKSTEDANRQSGMIKRIDGPVIDKYGIITVVGRPLQK